MSQSTKRKHVTKEVLDEFHLPDAHHRIVQVVAGRGNNLHQVLDPVADPQDRTYLASMPTKFRKNVWIKRGDYVVVEPIAEGDKVKGEIVRILYKAQVKYIKREGRWPKFPRDEEKDEGGDVAEPEKNPDGGSDSDDGLFRNTNRPKAIEPEPSSTEEEED